MPTFEVTIETPEDGTTLTLVVDAEHWVSAWREGLRIMGVRTPPPNAVCEVGSDESVRIGIPDSPGSWLVKRRTPPTRPPRQVVPPPATPDPCEAPLPPLPEESPAIAGYPRVPESRLRAGSAPADLGADAKAVRLSRRPPLGAAAQQLEAPAAKRGHRPAPDEDPLARRLGTGDRARLDRVAKRMAVPTINPGDEPTTRGGRFRVESTKQGRPASGGAEAGRQPDDLTSAYNAMESDATLLPQQFRAIASNRSGRLTPGGAPQEAVENAWQHIRCQLAQTLRYVRPSAGDTEALEVVAARGERERETLRCRVELPGAFEHLLSPRPARVKYSEDKTWLRFVDGRGNEATKLLVRSAACAPIIIGGRQWGVLLLLNSTRATGFAEGELRAISYLAGMLARELTTTR